MVDGSHLLLGKAHAVGFCERERRGLSVAHKPRVRVGTVTGPHTREREREMLVGHDGPHRPGLKENRTKLEHFVFFFFSLKLYKICIIYP